MTEYVNVEEAARIVGVSTQAVRIRCGSKKLASDISTGAIRILRADLTEWIAERAARAAKFAARYGTSK